MNGVFKTSRCTYKSLTNDSTSPRITAVNSYNRLIGTKLDITQQALDQCACWGIPHLSWAFPSSAGGRGRGGRVEVLWSGVWRTGLRAGTVAGDLVCDTVEGVGGWMFVSAWGGGGTCVAGLGGAGEEGCGGGGGGAGELFEEDVRVAVIGSSALGTSWDNCWVGGSWGSDAATAVAPFSGCRASALAGREDEELDGFWAVGSGEAPPLARAAASAARRSFFLRLNSAPKLELRGRRDEGGERLAGRLLWEMLPVPAEEVCLLPREREEERWEEE